MKATIYHNPRCSKSRDSLNLLKEKSLDFEIVEYLKTPLNAAEIQTLLTQLGIKAEQLIRKSEAIYKEHYKGKELNENEWIEAMVKHPKLIERPIVVYKNKAVIGRPLEKVEELLA
ncbi:arsenate reductase (glutaredoxin) [Aureispira sp. CCB-E]|uniref:arsenate reductase (glutaredoxin) n=1 Tax=Aureispira sp. CCB-E TaxID=3051121 RepID=UPI00286973F8|nr:arsenate reductase (glutaredoxin) [Aureispira sp. CCB-E]WMX12816.1 arsenate reductase (glutaredoxin) [Aureispira sp. CCB-E]